MFKITITTTQGIGHIYYSLRIDNLKALISNVKAIEKCPTRSIVKVIIRRII